MTGYIVPVLLLGAAGFLFWNSRSEPESGSPWFAVWVFAAGIVALIATMLPLFVGGSVPTIFNTLRVFFDVIALCVIAVMYLARR